jgi:hypothetical protein
MYSQNIKNIAGMEWTRLSQAVSQVIPEDAFACIQSYTSWMYTRYTQGGSQEPHHSQELHKQALHTVVGKLVTEGPIKFMRTRIQKDETQKYYQKKPGIKHKKIEHQVFEKALTK